jgi:propionate CoA-transferase (EC 2.8.3.1)
MRKVVDVNDALDFIKDGSVIAVSGFNMATTPEYLLLKLYETYRNTGHPRDLFFVADSLPAARNRALDLVAKLMIEDNDFGFIRGFMLTFLGVAPNLQRLVIENRVEAYAFPKVLPLDGLGIQHLERPQLRRWGLAHSWILGRMAFTLMT